MTVLFFLLKNGENMKREKFGSRIGGSLGVIKNIEF